MNAEILAVGTELLMGQIANTNAQYISEKLNSIGVNVYFHSVVGDNPKRLKDSLALALNRSDVVIMTGGLGPTQDDLTKETVAEAFNKKLVLHEESLQKLKGFFDKLCRPMTDNNIKQAYLPEGSTIVENNNGTAPGCIIEESGKIVVMLPGPPREMRPMVDETVIPYLLNKSNETIVSKYLRFFGIGESALEEKIIDLIETAKNPTIAPYAKEGEVTLRLSSKCSSKEEALQAIEPTIKAIQERIGEFLYSTENKELAEVVGELLLEKNKTIALAESCTGGLVAGKLTTIPGISKVFNRGFVTYSNEAKMQNLGVAEETLNLYGAVSKETAREMAQGVKVVSATDIGLSITGIAGPDGGTDQKPVGLVYVGLAIGDAVEVKELRLWGDRNRIRNMAVLNALDMIRRALIK